MPLLSASRRLTSRRLEMVIFEKAGGLERIPDLFLDLLLVNFSRNKENPCRSVLGVRKPSITASHGSVLFRVSLR